MTAGSKGLEQFPDDIWQDAAVTVIVNVHRRVETQNGVKRFDLSFCSSRDWAAKGTLLLGVKAVIAESYERIHRSNLVGMGVLPLQFKEGTNAQTLKLAGTETFDIVGLDANLKPQQDLGVRFTRANGQVETVPVTCRIDTPIEIEYYQHGGILPYVLRQLMAKA